jgi:DNA methylase
MEKFDFFERFPNFNQQSLLEAVKSKAPVRGLTHNFYRYPARFSPLFAREIIKAFTNKGDLVLDPFMGGGTTLVESLSLGRASLGLDVSTLSTFISQAKTTLLSEKDIISIRNWSDRIQDRINLRNPAVRAIDWELKGYQQNISNRTTWPIRKTLELILATLHEISNKRQNQFIRCALLKTAQWAFDRFKIPSAKEFRKAFIINISEMIDDIKKLNKNRKIVTSTVKKYYVYL